MVLAATQGIALDVHPSNFATIEGTDVYLDDDIGTAGQLPLVGWAILARIDEYVAFADAAGQYVEELRRGLTARLSREQAASIGLAASLEGVMARSEQARTARAVLLRTVAELGGGSR
jgi:hypothetical protein